MFESARQRIVIDDEVKQDSTAIRDDDGGRDNQLVSSAGETQPL